MPLRQLLKDSPGELQSEMQLILNALVEGIVGADAQGNVRFCNQALLKMTGYDAGEVVGKNLHALLHHHRPDGTEYPEEDCPLWRAYKSQQPIDSLREFIWRKDGAILPVEYHAHPLPQPTVLTACVIAVHDVSEREQATAALRSSEERFRRILGTVADVAWTADRDRRTIYISPKVEGVLGYRNNEIYAAGASFRSGLIHPEDFGRVNRNYRALFEEDRAFDEEYRIRRKDGSWIWIHDRAMGVHQEDGVLYADGVFSDITRRKNAEAELQWKTAFLEAQVNSTIDGILVVGGNGQRLLHNQRFVEMFHFPPESLSDKSERPMFQHRLESVKDLVKDPESFMAKINYLHRHPAETSRDEIEFKDGMVIDRYSAPVIDKEGKYYGRIWNFRDITERRCTEDTLRQLSMAVEQSPVSVIITDEQGRIMYVNQKFTADTGYRADEVLGKNPRILNAGLSPPEHFRGLWSTIKQGREWRGELCNRRKNGEIYWEAATIRPITDAKGVITNYLAVNEDITERRRAEQELRASRQLLQSILDAITQRVFWKDRNCN